MKYWGARIVFAGLLWSQMAVAQEVQVVSPDNAPPRPADDKAIITGVWENDKFGHEDRDYTNGARLSWLSAEDTAPKTLNTLARLLPNDPTAHHRISVAVGQNMYTPTDLTLNPPDPNDRPYAGWTYASLGIISENKNILDSSTLTLGVVGPASYAEQTQKFIHKVTDSQHPNGWDSQLDNEPGVIFSMERKWRSLVAFNPLGLGIDFTPQAGVDLGNVLTDANVGTMMRIGFDLPADYGPPRIGTNQRGSDFFLPTETLGGYLFAGVDGRAVAHNIFLDGNTFSSSPSVDREVFVGSVQAGAALTYQSFRLSYTQIFMTEEFKEQKKPQQFGAISLSYRF